MILEFSCSNHRSIKNKITFSTIATSDNTHQESLKNFSGNNVLPSAIIYGANGSGKSNFLNALEFMKELVSQSLHLQPGERINQVPHKLAALETPSEYDIQFTKGDIRYAYGFSIVKKLIKSEYLYYFPNGRKVMIFERSDMQINPGSQYKTAFELANDALKENRLFLSCAANFTNLGEIINAFKFFNEDVVIYKPNMNNWTVYSINLMKDNDEIKKIFIDILKALGTGIRDADLDIEQVTVEDLPPEIPKEIKNLISSKSLPGTRFKVKIVYDKFETDLMNEESAGIKKLFELICPVIDIISNGKVLICDELEANLHESLVYQLVKLFQYGKKEQFAQLIFSTHDTSLLDSRLFRRDQIWFTQLDNDRSTDLYSLAEIRNVRKTENLERGYISGKYGAIPMLNKKLFQFFDMKNEKN